MSLYGVKGREVRKLKWNSTALDSTVEQAKIVASGVRANLGPIDVDGKPIVVRSSNTFVSTVFSTGEKVREEEITEKRDKIVGKAGKKESLHQKVVGKQKKGEIMTEKIMGNAHRVSNGKNRKVQKKVFTISDILAKAPLRDKGLDKSFYDKQSAKNNAPEKTQTPRAVTPEPSVRSVSPTSTLSLEITSNTGLDTTVLREHFKGHQILSVFSSSNPITGRLSNSALIVIKPNSDLDSLMKKLVSKGMSVKEKVSSIGRKNRFDEFKDESFERGFGNDSSKSLFKHHLESSDDLFGSSPGVGRYMPRSRTPDKQAVALHSWNEIRFPSKEVYRTEFSTPPPSYMKSTQSWASKSKKIVQFLY